MKTIKITPEWVLEKLSHTLDTNGTGILSLYAGSASDANWIELALSSLEISFETYDYLSEHKDLVFGFDFRIEDIEIECPNLYRSACEIERSKNGSTQVSRNVDCGIHEIDNNKVESESARIIQEFKEQNEIEHITEEELTNLFSESTLYPNYYWHGSEEYFTYFAISDYEYFQLKNGYNPFTGKFLIEDNRVDYHILEEVDTIDDSDVFHEIAWTDKKLTYEQALKQLSLFEREFLIMDEYYNLHGSGIFDLDDNLDDYFRLVDPNYEYEFMKVEEPDSMVPGELEYSLEDDLEYYKSLRTKTIDVYVSDRSEVAELLNRELEETAYQLKIHWDTGDNKFLIVVVDEEQLYYYKVGLESDIDNCDNTKYLGSCTNPKYVLDIIQYYYYSGKSLGYCDGSSEVEFIEGTDSVNNQVLSEGKIDLILDLASQRYYAGKINLGVEQALIVMLSITHFFKFEMDHQKQWYNKHRDRMDKELANFKKNEGIIDWQEEMKWIHKNGALQYHICIQDLLLQTLHKLNGAYYRINDRDYDWEDEFDKIFVEMPYGREFDMAMLDFLLLPLYNSIHGTNYVIDSRIAMNIDNLIKE